MSETESNPTKEIDFRSVMTFLTSTLSKSLVDGLTHLSLRNAIDLSSRQNVPMLRRHCSMSSCGQLSNTRLLITGQRFTRFFTLSEVIATSRQTNDLSSSFSLGIIVAKVSPSSVVQWSSSNEVTCGVSATAVWKNKTTSPREVTVYSVELCDFLSCGIAPNRA